MCGIIGCVSGEPVAGMLLEGLRRVEYRGYDSAGMATISDEKIEVRKGAGKVKELERKLKFSAMSGSIGMAHCLHPSTLVQLADGRLKRIADMDDEERVISLDSSALRVVARKALKFAHPSPSRLLRIGTDSTELVCTGNHLMLVARNGAILERLSSQLQVGDLLILPKQLRIEGRSWPLAGVRDRNYVRVSRAWSDAVRLALKRRGISLADAAERLGLTTSYMEHVASADRSILESAARRVEDWLGIGISDGLTPVSHSHGNYLTLPTHTSVNLMQIVGYVWGDGYVHKKGVRIRERDRDLLSHYQDLFLRVFSLAGPLTKLRRQGAFQLAANGTSLSRWFAVNFGKRSNEFITTVGSLPDEEVSAFVRGLFDAEGAVNLVSRQLTIRMTDSNLIRVVQSLLLRFGIHSSFSTQRRRRLGWSDSYCLSISGNGNIARFASAISSSSELKRRKLQDIAYRTRAGLSFREIPVPFTKRELRAISVGKGVDHYLQRNEYPTEGTATVLLEKVKQGRNNSPLEEVLERFAGGEVYFERVHTLSPVESDTPIVYDLEVEGTRNFVANGIFTHNSRWATHGGVTDANAHPQTSCKDRVAVIHNGIIENYLPLKKQLIAKGHVFKSETDTEVIAHLVEKEYARTKDPVKATMAAARMLKGQYAMAVMLQGRPDVIVGARKDAPLIIGLADGKNFVASDVLAFIEYTDRTIFLDNLEVAEVRRDGVRIFAPNGKEVRRKPTQVAWELSDISKMDYAHYTLKEINEQPRTVVSAAMQDERKLSEFAASIRRAKSLSITAAGSSYHAGMLMKFRLNKEANIRCDAILAGEFKEHSDFVGRGSAVIVLSQSGETADVLEAVKEAKKKGAAILSIVNAAGSSLARESDVVLLLNCGPEVGVAATKSFTAQVVVVNLVVDAVLGGKRENGLDELSRAVEAALRTEEQIIELAARYRSKPDFYFVARGFHYPVALEGALKLKELSYIHAEGMPASELKHGTIALIEKGTPVVVVNPSGDTHDDALSNAEELKARGAEVIGVSDTRDAVYVHFVEVPKVQPKYMPVVEAIPLQLLAYHTAVAKRNDPDYPRNLAKSVTVK